LTISHNIHNHIGANRRNVGGCLLSNLYNIDYKKTVRRVFSHPPFLTNIFIIYWHKNYYLHNLYSTLIIYIYYKQTEQLRYSLFIHYIYPADNHALSVVKYYALLFRHPIFYRKHSNSYRLCFYRLSEIVNHFVFYKTTFGIYFLS